jgi:hypothetical protein
MTSYSVFNNWVYDYYLNNCIPNQINSLSIPVSEIDEFIVEYNIELNSFKEINNESWSYLIKEKNGIPQFFGLIALQCLAAFKMQNQNGFTAANFKDRFADLIGVINPSDLNSFFSEGYNDELKIQEKIWLSVQSFLSSKQINIILPPISRYAGRFIQFPKSQIVLNFEDLKEYHEFFILIKKEFDYISFEDFRKYYINRKSYFISNFKRPNNVKNDSQWSDIEYKIKLKQIFDYYCSDEWINKIVVSNINDKNSSSNYIIKHTQSELLLFDEFHNKLENLNELVRRNRFMIFKENENYPNEYESVSTICFENNNIVLIYKSASNSNEINIFNNSFSIIPYDNLEHNILIYQIKNSGHLPDFIKNKITSDYPIELKGFKVSGKKKYFVNSPPKIHRNNEIIFQIYFNKKRISEEEINKIGKYTIKVNGYTNYNFELIEVPVLDYPSNDKSKLLLFNSLEYEENEEAGINGLQIKYKNQLNIETLTINNWIKVNKGNKINSNIQLLKTISQSINGKY